MTDSDRCAIMGSYTTFKHIKTRKVVVLEVEVAEEHFEEVISKLGMPIGGESKPVAIALLHKHENSYENSFSENEKSEGENLRTRAVLLCKDSEFQEYTKQTCWSLSGVSATEECASEHLKSFCGINSRSELATNIEAQSKFKELLEKYKDWQFENNYSDNINRI